MQCVRRKSSKGTVQYDERYQKPAIINNDYHPKVVYEVKVLLLNEFRSISVSKYIPEVYKRKTRRSCEIRS